MKSLDKFRIVIVGCGLFGLTIARKIVEDLNQEVLIIDKRDHIGGNAWSYDDPETGIEIHKYGSHLFHTSNLNIWNFINRFSSFTDYKHKVYSVHQDQIYSLPINLATISQFFGKVFSPDEARRFLESETDKAGEATNLEEKAIQLVGARLYEAFIKGYTAKQWQTNPRLLPPEIISRLPVRFNFDNSYFDDLYQGLPINGYHEFLRNLASHPKISIQLNTDYFKVRDSISPGQLLVFTGPIDAFFDFSLGKLSWRTLDFEVETMNCQDFQGTSVINYSDESVPFTRIHEFRHLHPSKYKEVKKTVIMREYSRFATSEKDEPYYPVNTLKDRELLLKYRKMANELQNVIFGGRLGTYQYLDMHMAIGSALSRFESEFRRKYENLFLEQKL